jgi:hypothetical protein
MIGITHLLLFGYVKTAMKNRFKGGIVNGVFGLIINFNHEPGNKTPCTLLALWAKDDNDNATKSG